MLLNKGYTMQGVMLASTAIEKSFKAGICILTGKKVFGHMDKFENFKAIIEEKGFGRLIELIDARFIDILINAYKLRYYDTVDKPTVIGFLKNQFLEELDSAFSLFDKLYILEDETGKKLLTPLQSDFEKKNPDLIENNWLAQSLEKKTFMETGCEGFAVYIHPEINVSSQKLTLPYEGARMLINVLPDLPIK